MPQDTAALDTDVSRRIPDWSTLLRPIDESTARIDLPDRPSVLFGRSLQADVVLVDPTASREHARLTATGQGVLIEDLDSATGTWVNGIRVDRLLLQTGDRLQIGTQQWAFETDSPEPTLPTPAAPDSELTLRHLDPQTGLHSLRLSALIDGCGRLDQAHTLDQIAGAVTRLARLGSGYQLARWFDATADGYRCRSSSPAKEQKQPVSLTLLRAASSRQVLHLGPHQVADYSQSLHRQNLQATLAIAIEPDPAHRAVLVIDRRDSDPDGADIPEFCRALASVARLAWNGLLQKQAVLDERQRLHDQLHDDLGARLLDQVYQAETPEQADRARNLLNDLRDLVSHPVDQQALLHDVLADVCGELNERAERAGVQVRVDQWSGPALPIETEASLLIRRSVRELTTNALKHARPQALMLSAHLEGTHLHLQLTQTAKTDLPDQWQHGHGLSRMSQRLRQTGGRLDIEQADDQTHFTVIVPLAADAQVLAP